MAGLGRKVFVAGEVLTAANVQGYLMDQAVMLFADEAARTTAIPTPSAGMVTYLVDIAKLQFYNGEEWEAVGTGTGGGGGFETNFLLMGA